ncbi:ATP-grasp domain-containing protein [Prevotella sp. MA2016]|uniref:ATP-grasp domain-containing protein n=1 Tax=Prevotella sp. MA2016 TaxID=1408310 RepID=UPI000491EBB7|nr:ATP-grasp domain-containing protein [Prevotella sp. MA2016]
MRNKVIIIGINHFNTLGLIRSFGVNSIKPHVIIVNPDNYKNFCVKSKYVGGYHIVHSDEEALRILVENFHDEPCKPVLVPSSDGAVYMIDNNHDILESRYYLPHINHKNGEIARLMNKFNQALWAQELGIPTAKTFLINFDNGEELYNRDFPMPCIVKPVLSHEGCKADIKRCDSREELLSYCEELKTKGYFRILLQEFLIKDYEMELFGAVLEREGVVPYILTKHVREWPVVGGSVCCHKFIIDESYHKQARIILKKIQDYGFVGNFDIEIINVAGKIYLNEINFRNSGDIYACFNNKLFYSYYSYLDMIGDDLPTMNMTYTENYYAMCEDRDFLWVKEGLIPFKEWYGYFRRTKDFAYLSWNDMRPCIAFYYMILSGFVMNRIKRLFKKNSITN